MVTQAKYEVSFTGMPLGQSVVEFNYDSALFAAYPESDVMGGAGTIILDLIKHSSMIEVKAKIEGEVQIECDRCADAYTQPIDFSGDVVVKMSEEQGEYDGDIIWVNPRSTSIDLTQWIYESIILSLPLQRVHPDMSQCDAEALKYIQTE